jgi:hypothetical protein
MPRFVGEPPLTTRDCADYMGLRNTDWIRRAITEGVRVQGQVVTLDAETLLTNGRHLYRIYEEQFTEFLRAIGWKHLPARQVH